MTIRYLSSADTEPFVPLSLDISERIRDLDRRLRDLIPDRDEIKRLATLAQHGPDNDDKSSTSTNALDTGDADEVDRLAALVPGRAKDTLTTLTKPATTGRLTLPDINEIKRLSALAKEAD